MATVSVFKSPPREDMDECIAINSLSSMFVTWVRMNELKG